MRRPSGRVLRNRVDISHAVEGTSGAGVTYSYPSRPDLESVPCSVQPQVQDTDPESLARLTRVNRYSVHFGGQVDVAIRDKLVWVDDAGDDHTLMVETDYDNAGRAAMWTVDCVEVT